ncbi:hypothetical protein BJX64DRAFT_291445 [Aspergillus heterothallicus]
MTTAESREENYTAAEEDDDDGYAHSDEDVNSKDLESTPGEDEIDNEEITKLSEAAAYRTEQTKGALHVRFIAPGPNETKVSTILAYVGESEVLVEEDSAPVIHPSFESYYKPAVLNGLEEEVYFDCEAHPKYHSVYPGALTVHGYGLECWEFEDILGPLVKTEAEEGEGDEEDDDEDDDPILLPDVQLKQVLRRLSELRPAKGAAAEKESARLGADPEEDKLHVLQFIGSDPLKEAESRQAEKNGSPASASDDDKEDTVLDALFRALNRGLGIVDYSTDPNIGNHWIALHPEAGQQGMRLFIRQMIISAEILRRLEAGDDEGKSGKAKFDPKHLTVQAVSSLIICQQWMANVEMRMTPGLPLPPAKVVSNKEREQADAALQIAEGAMEIGMHELAAQTLATAIEIDPANVEYRQTLVHALLKAGEEEEEEENEAGAKVFYEQAVVEGRRLTQYAENDWLAWGFYAMARLAWGGIKESLQAWEHALELATDEDDKKTVKDNIAAARMAMVEEFLSASRIEDRHERHPAFMAIKDWDFDLLGNVLRWYSTVHKRQEEGLIAFAESIQWPYVDEVRKRVTGLYDRIWDLKEDNILFSLHDWMYGLHCPGHWFADSAINALVVCSASLKSLGVSSCDNIGLVLPGVTYWRTMTKVGRVLGALPGANSVNGWIGPCPPAKIDQGWKSGHKAQWVDIPFVAPALVHRAIKIGDIDPVNVREDEDADAYLEEVKDASKWTIPSPPQQDTQRYTVKAINLNPSSPDQDKDLDLVCDVTITFEVHSTNESETNNAENRSSIRRRLFHRDKSANIVCHDIHLEMLSTFVVPPECHMADGIGHPVHARELHLYQMKSWTPAQLADETTWKLAAVGNMLLINATGEGAEVMARAICSLRALSAVVRKPGGPCFRCAVESAKRLRILALIWCD